MVKNTKRTIVYIDGFNLFYRALKSQKNKKWLNLYALCKASLPKDCEIVAIKYYTARVSGKISPDSPKDQQAYLSALNTIPCIEAYFGSFQVSEKIAYLAQPLLFQPSATRAQQPPPKFAKIVKTEEKGSDVNLGVHLVRDAFLKSFDQAAVLTNDTDLNEPVKIVAKELGMPVILLTPTSRPAKGLTDLASSVRHIEPYITSSQFPDQITTEDGKVITKPSNW